MRADPHLIAAHLESVAAARVYPPGGPWGRALGWWQRAAEIAPALPLGLAADLGMLLSTPHHASLASPLSRLRERGTGGEGVAYETFLQEAAATPAARTARALGLSDLAVAALLAHLAQAAPIPAEYHLPSGLHPADIAEALALYLLPPATCDLPPATCDLPPATCDLRPATCHLPPATCHLPPATCHLPPLLARLASLAPADVRFLHTIAGEALGAADLADLRGLGELLDLPSLSHTLLDEVLAFAPALADVNPGASVQTYTADGYGGLNRVGSLDAVLPSEWALPEELLSYRFLNGELLYYGHERPPERRKTLLLLLVQLGDAMAGDLELLAKASALALGRAALAHGMAAQLIFFDAALHPAQGLARPAEVAALVRRTGQGGLNLLGALEQVQAHVRAQAPAYAEVELIWFLHAQAGADQVAALEAPMRQLRRQARSRALFVSAGHVIARPALADRLAGQWASLGSTALHDAEERARAARALRELATPRPEKGLAEDPPQPRRRAVAGAVAPADPAEPLLARGQWDEALDLLEPRARSGDAGARLLLVALIEGPSLTPQPPLPQGERGSRSPLPPRGGGVGGGGHEPPSLTLRLRAAGLLGALGDPRLLDPRAGDSAVGGYWRPIPAGSFWFGDEGQGEARAQRLSYAFHVGRYPVTNAEYRRFIEAGGYQRREWWSEHGWPYLQASESRFKSNGRQITHPWYWFDPEYNQPSQPVVGVSWWEAAAYCAWLTAQGRAAGWLPQGATIRLPTSLEWERAARGDERRLYPWGDAAPDGERANYDATQLGRPAPVGCFPAGAAPCGAQDLAGNIMEWLATPEDAPAQLAPLGDADPDALVLLSHAAFDDDASALRCGARIESGPFARYLDRGFRAVLIHM